MYMRRVADVAEGQRGGRGLLLYRGPRIDNNVLCYTRKINPKRRYFLKKKKLNIKRNIKKEIKEKKQKKKRKRQKKKIKKTNK